MTVDGTLADAVQPPWVSVVVPAYNEQAVIERCLTRLLTGAPAGVEVVVVDNASTDQTAARVRRFAAGPVAIGHHVRLLTEPTPGKPAALRRGWGCVTGTPVIVVDADVELDSAVLGELVTVLGGRESPTVAVPELSLDTVGCHWVVRRWAAVWSALPYAREHLVGSGVFGVNGAGARVIADLPDVLNDDAWVRGRFGRDQRCFVPGRFVVHAPLTARSLVARRARVLLGNAELARAAGPDADRTGRGDLVRLVRSGKASWLDMATFVGVSVAARWTAERRRVQGRSATWSTDTTTRIEAEV